MRPSFPFLLPFLLAFGSCAPDEELTWFGTCGDPVCQGYTGPVEGVPLCTDERAGVACDDADATCDPEDSCNALLLCTDEDPTQQEGGCPISRKRAKRDIHYLAPEERAAVAESALDVKLSTWRYRWDPVDAPARLGFLIDDREGGFGVTADGDHVDLYGYTSLVLATTQEQARRIEAQDARIEAQAARIEALEARLSAIETGAVIARRWQPPAVR